MKNNKVFIVIIFLIIFKICLFSQETNNGISERKYEKTAISMEIFAGGIHTFINNGYMFIPSWAIGILGKYNDSFSFGVCFGMDMYSYTFKSISGNNEILFYELPAVNLELKFLFGKKESTIAASANISADYYFGGLRAFLGFGIYYCNWVINIYLPISSTLYYYGVPIKVTIGYSFFNEYKRRIK